MNLGLLTLVLLSTSGAVLRKQSLRGRGDVVLKISFPSRRVNRGCDVWMCSQVDDYNMSQQEGFEARHDQLIFYVSYEIDDK